jgi:hypothetical protein
MCAVDFVGAPKGNRTPVFAVRGRRPRPLDDGSKGRFAMREHAIYRLDRVKQGRDVGSNRGSSNLRAVRLERGDASSDLRGMASGPMARAMR